MQLKHRIIRKLGYTPERGLTAKDLCRQLNVTHKALVDAITALKLSEEVYWLHDHLYLTTTPMYRKMMCSKWNSSLFN